MTHPRIKIPPMCDRHNRLVVESMQVTEDGPWQAAILIAQIYLFQRIMERADVHAALGDDVSRFDQVIPGCPACRFPDEWSRAHKTFTKGLDYVVPLTKTAGGDAEEPA